MIKMNDCKYTEYVSSKMLYTIIAFGKRMLDDRFNSPTTNYQMATIKDPWLA